ncbi:alpha/beta hydrolase [Enterococcus saccharolyticus]|uniref:Esterase n=1 Tax=Candidatus Enterococcus willemsii TaxID=1857215 RepID=A0ABQ6YY04_9ENTE|nr:MULTISPECIES: alpha/beta hydrolase [Enterococcus]KAF1302540.1 esterase [Enterococcus sp. CU12B]MCD5003000.1 alpha/beta hydrolase [Enterococcus saccharolyticus]
MTNLTLSTGATVTVTSPTDDQHKFMLYFHGGGFVYGSKNDLPQALAQHFLTAGYTILAVDYLLAPNHSLKEILTSIRQTFAELKQTMIKDAPFSFCGRSAGGYAILSLTAHLLETEETLPENLVNFYGYYDLDFINNPRQLSDLTITSEMIATIDQESTVWDDPLLQRSVLYMYGVQQQKMAEFYQVTDESMDDFAISQEQLKQFPRTFSTASTTDEEVPFKYSKSLKRLIPNCKFVPVYDLSHDFLKQPEHEQVQKVFTQLENWLQSN